MSTTVCLACEDELGKSLCFCAFKRKMYLIINVLCKIFVYLFMKIRKIIYIIIYIYIKYIRAWLNILSTLISVQTLSFKKNSNFQKVTTDQLKTIFSRFCSPENLLSIDLLNTYKLAREPTEKIDFSCASFSGF